MAKKVELYTPEFYYKCGIGGALSCGLTHALVTPLDMVKCRLQVAAPGTYSGIIDGFRKIVAAEGAVALTTGWAPTLIGYSAQGLCKFGFYEFFKKTYGDMLGPENAEKYRTWVYLAGSASAEVIADAALCSMEAVKVRVQTQPGYAKGLRDGLPKIIAAEGYHGLFKGLGPLWARQIPYTMMKFAAFERTVEAIYKHVLSKPKSEYNKTQQLGVTFVSGYIAGVFCAVVSHPADFVVSQLNKVKTEGGAWDASKQILKQAGFTGVWKGLGARIIMIGTLTALQWFIYDSFKVYVGLPTSGAPAKKVEEVKA